MFCLKMSYLKRDHQNILFKFSVSSDSLKASNDLGLTAHLFKVKIIHLFSIILRINYNTIIIILCKKPSTIRGKVVIIVNTKIKILIIKFQTLNSPQLLNKNKLHCPFSQQHGTSWELSPQFKISDFFSIANLTLINLQQQGTQECQRSLFASFFCEGKEKWIHMLCEVLEGQFTMISSITMQGLHIVAFIQKQKLAYITDVYTSKMKTGFCGCVGNKGAVELGFNVGAKRFLFINNHLEAHQENSSRRSDDLLKIINEMVESSSYDEAFLFGDLNYRINMTSQQFERYQITNCDTLSLIDRDQLNMQKKLQWFRSMFSEGKIQFFPTYKLEATCNKYSLKRVPGWTDRIFWKSDSKQLVLKQYNSQAQVLGSDHRPVFASFVTKFGLKKQGFVRIKELKKGFCC